MANVPIRVKHSRRCPLCMLSHGQIKNAFIVIVTSGFTDEERLRLYKIVDAAMLPREDPDERAA